MIPGEKAPLTVGVSVRDNSMQSPLATQSNLALSLIHLSPSHMSKSQIYVIYFNHNFLK